MKIEVEISVGELLDKITILELKSERISDPQKLAHVAHELRILNTVQRNAVSNSPKLKKLIRRLKQINEALWDIEDQIRQCESRQDFGEKFIDLSRSVYQTNDQRASLKREINHLTGSSIVEEKSYSPY